jgi:predicted Zn finger-like uncharacterized protein
MIAACPKCHTRYRVQPEQLGPDGARLRCSSCNAVFRVRSPGPATSLASSSEQSAPPEAPGDTREAPLRSSAQAGRPAGAAAEGRGTRDESKASEAHPEVAEARRLHRNDGLEGHRSDSSADPQGPARTSASQHVLASDAPEPGPRYDRERLVVIGHTDPDASKDVAEALEGWGLQTLVAHDGVEAMLAIQRALPRAVVLDAALPRMYGFQVCEIVKRNESLRETRVVLVGAIHKEERYRRAPRELYGADVYVEPPDLPDALFEILTRFGLPLQGDAAPGGQPARPAAPYGHVARGGSGPARDSRTEPLLADSAAPAAYHELTREAPSREATQEARPRSAPGGRPASGAAGGGVARSPQASEAIAQRSEAERSASGWKADEAQRDVPAARQLDRNDGLEGRRADAGTNLRAPAGATAVSAPSAPADALTPERAKAERLARIIVSDIVLYNPEKFDAAARSGGDVAAAMRDELEEGRSLFRERVAAQVRAERDYLAEELERVAKARRGR